MNCKIREKIIAKKRAEAKGEYYKFDNELIIRAVRDTGCIVTVEEHNVIGGLGGAVAELLSSEYPVPVIRHGVNDTFGRSGKASEVLEYYKLTAQDVAGSARAAIQKKS